jgi:hypothetical protein
MTLQSCHPKSAAADEGPVSLAMPVPAKDSGWRWRHWFGKPKAYRFPWPDPMYIVPLTTTGEEST